MVCARASRPGFLAVSALLFAAGAALTIAHCASMPEMPLCGGSTMSTTWLRLPGQSWPAAAAAFLAMWLAMMVAMMLPSLAPMLWRHRQAVGTAGWLTALAGLGYFLVWTVLGMAVFSGGAALAAAERQLPVLARAAPAAIAAVVLIAGALQFTAWKARRLACLREASIRGGTLAADAGSAFHHGLRLGLHCALSCAGPTAVLLAVGIMDLRAMAAVTAAITAERLAPAGERVARATGAVLVGAGLLLLAQAASG